MLPVRLQGMMHKPSSPLRFHPLGHLRVQACHVVPPPLWRSVRSCQCPWSWHETSAPPMARDSKGHITLVACGQHHIRISFKLVPTRPLDCNRDTQPSGPEQEPLARSA